MMAFKKMLVMVKGRVLSPLVRCLLRRHKEDEDESVPKVGNHLAAERGMDEENMVTTTGIDSNIRVANDGQDRVAGEITTETEDEDGDRILSTEPHSAPPLVAQLLQQPPPRLPSNIVCILPNSDLGIQFAEAIRALSPPLKPDIENATASRQVVLQSNEIPVALNPPAPPVMPEASKYPTLPLYSRRAALSSKASKPTTEPGNVFRFLDMPAEIRWMMYQIHFESQDINVTRSRDYVKKDASGPKAWRTVVRISASTFPLRYVCRQLYDEVSAAMLNFSNFDLIKGRHGWNKINERNLPSEIILTMRRFSSHNANFARKIWEIKQNCEDEEVVVDKLLQQRPGSSFQIGSLTRRGFTMNRLKEISLYTSTDLFRGLTLPQWMTEDWYSDGDMNTSRVFEIVAIRQLLEDIEKHVTHEFWLRLKPANQAFKHREIELKANGPVVIRGVPNTWHEPAMRRIQRWLQFSRGRTIMFEDSRYHSGSKAGMPKIGRS